MAILGFTLSQNDQQQDLEDQRAAHNQKLEERRAQDEALQAYLDQMSTLLLEKDLSDNKVHTLIRARTVTLLSRVDPGRKTQVMQFLDEADLLQRRVEERASISLEAADLSGANLIEVRLFRADLTDADLSNTYARPWLRTSTLGYYLTFPGFFIIPVGGGLSHGGSWPIGPGLWSGRRPSTLPWYGR